jgi:hypothetical protein
MPVISQGRVQSGTGKLTFVTGPDTTGIQSTSAVASGTTTTTTTSGTGATGPTGPTGPAGVAGQVLSSSALVLTLPGTVSAAAAALLLSTGHSLLVVQVAATTAETPQNYILTLYDGNPTLGGSLLYQATGITAQTYTDNAPFFMSAPTSGAIWGQITNIDADATTLTLVLKFMALS